MTLCPPHQSVSLLWSMLENYYLLTENSTTSFYLRRQDLLVQGVRKLGALVPACMFSYETKMGGKRSRVHMSRSVFVHFVSNKTRFQWFLWVSCFFRGNPELDVKTTSNAPNIVYCQVHPYPTCSNIKACATLRYLSRQGDLDRHFNSASL